MNLKNLLKNILFEKNLPGTALFVGRMQPLTIAHYNIINDARKKYQDIFIIIVSGKTKDPKTNPLSFRERVRLTYKAFEGKIPESHILKAPNAFTPDILKMLTGYIRKKKIKEHFIVFAGEDRAADYQRQIEQYYAGEAKIEVVAIPREEDSISATKVRKALTDNDKDTYQRLMPKTLWHEFDNLRNLIAQNKMNLSDGKINLDG